jgi:hypothetical protein
MVNFAITTRHLDTVFSLELACSSGESLRRILPLAGKNNGALIDHPSPELLFLSLDAGEIGQPGCQLTATLQTKAGRSDPVELGTIRRLPRILQFSLSEEKISENLYLGTLTGEELQTIEKTGWDLHTGYPVQSLPIPAAQIQGRQTLRIALSWPAPSPHASLYIWLRGESEGRLTRIKY